MLRTVCMGLALVGVACGNGGLTRPSPSDASMNDGPGSKDGPPMVDAASALDASRPDASRSRGAVDVLFMIDNSSEMSRMQDKLVAQLPSFVSALGALPGGMPDLHVAVVSSDMGAPGDVMSSIRCTTSGDDGAFQTLPRGMCSSSGLAGGATFISNVAGVANYAGSLTDVLSCILPLGDGGCGFEHQLAAVARALGADGAPPPAGNAGFLRPDAELAIFVLTNEDDCSAPADTTLFSLNGGQQSVTNPLGPITNYRCNQFGHLCQDPTGPQPDAWLPPPLAVPADAAGDPPKLALSACVSNDGPDGLLTPVATFVQQIGALKADPARIVVGGTIAPATPYTVAWMPPAVPPPGGSGELWPFTMHSCGQPGAYGLSPGAQTAIDGSFGDPAVRVGQWVQALGGFTTSVCDPDYAAALQMFAAAIGRHL